MSNLKLFVYGSLKQHEYNWHVIEAGVQSCRPASLAGAMYLRHDGYPALAVEADGAKLGTRDYRADLTSQLDRPTLTSGSLVQGQLLVLSPGPLWTERLDLFEGYFPGAPSEYLRMLVAVQVEGGWESAWTYTAVSTPPADWPRIEEWNRSMVENLEPYQHEHG